VGWPGVGLIFLRATLALNALICGVSALITLNISPSVSIGTAWIVGILALVVGLALLVGFLTPLASLLAAAGYLVSGISSVLAAGASLDRGSYTAFDLAAVSIALIVLGPGAFSLDARLFGRREIIIPEARRPRRG
jgi:uncharacterized membrane protein YphA (DoxX/SURF4 family)